MEGKETGSGSRTRPTNLLDMSRMQAGALGVAAIEIGAEEIVPRSRVVRSRTAVLPACGNLAFHSVEYEYPDSAQVRKDPSHHGPSGRDGQTLTAGRCWCDDRPPPGRPSRAARDSRIGNLAARSRGIWQPECHGRGASDACRSDRGGPGGAVQPGRHVRCCPAQDTDPVPGVQQGGCGGTRRTARPTGSNGPRRCTGSPLTTPERPTAGQRRFADPAGPRHQIPQRCPFPRCGADERRHQANPVTAMPRSMRCAGRTCGSSRLPT